MRNFAVVFAGILSTATATGLLAVGCGSNAAVAASSGGGTGGGGGAAPCENGNFRSCTCPSGATGTQSCAAATWAACDCSASLFDGGSDGSDAAAVCGDQFCDPTENCKTCPTDCGKCAKCDLAPGCSGAFSVPTSPMVLASFDNNGQTSYISGAGTGVTPDQTTCSDPQLKIRLKDIKIHLNGVSGNLDMFCMVSGDDGQSSELMVSQEFSGLGDDAPVQPVQPSSGLFWGQKVGKEKLSPYSITISYQCFQVTKNGALEAALGAIAGVAGAGANVPGNPYGWAFGLGGAAASAAQAAVMASDGNTLFLNVQQTIDAGALLDLTNGRDWVVRQKGSGPNTCGFSKCDWDWELTVEAWGCADPRIGPAG